MEEERPRSRELNWNISFKNVCVYLPACRYVPYTRAWALEGQKRELVPLELELQTFGRD